MSVSLVFCTVPSAEVGQQIARTLVEQRAAACVKIIPGVTSVYRWQGQVEVAEECQLLIKTSADNVAGAWHWVQQLHPYDVPEWLVIDNAQGSDAYLDWIAAQTH